jgi:hypothetical protein
MIHASNAMAGRVVVGIDATRRVLGFGPLRFFHPEDQVFARMLTGCATGGWSTPGRGHRRTSTSFSVIFAV